MTQIHHYPDTDSIGSLTTLHDSASRYRCLIEGIAQIVWETDASGDVITRLPDWETFTGQTHEEVRNGGWLNAVHPDDRASMSKTWADSIEGQIPYQVEHRLRHHSGEYRWMAARGVPVFYPDGTIAEWVGLHTDITDRKTTELALHAQAAELVRLNVLSMQMMALVDRRNHDLDQFAHTIAHDLKAPLRAIFNLSQWIEDDLSGKIPIENEHQLQLLRTRASRMEKLIDGLLAYSRLGSLDLTVETVVVTELLADIVDSISASKSFKITVSIDLPPIQTKRCLLGQVFSNLIGNAIKHHDRLDGQIEITGHAIGQLAKGDLGSDSSAKNYVFSVKDDGPGIAIENQDVIYGIFKTLDNKPENTGIGLAIVKRIIETEGEQLTLLSAIGQGTTFKFTWSGS